ncbi:phage baseplate assembly protein V [Streptomyces sp. NBC_01304]|uniref:phage baseplate assembly protein V n=1 Tax=Streptomyces sp. NBC_01304 TaxID=2903818 RepID=UPI002E0E1888|nr:phage baseplate assembly protein V [Streptomyces sp. NBC_01304]
MAAPSNRYLGKFRGKVIDNNDPLRIGRVTVEVPDVLGNEASTWALPCLPFTGLKAGQFVVPSKGAGVWVEFEQGDPSYPIWTGCWYGDEGELPPDARDLVEQASEHKPVVVQTPNANKIVMSDAPGADRGIRLQAEGGSYIHITPGAIIIATGGGAEIRLEGERVTIKGLLNMAAKQ